MRETTFEQWCEQSATRFAKGYIDSRLTRERRKAASIVANESKWLRRWFEPRNVIRTAVRYSGLRKILANNALRIELSYHDLVLADLPRRFIGYKILQISDLHFNNDPQFLNNLITLVKQADYDLCVLTGDYRYRSFGPSDTALEGLKKLRQAVDSDVVAILGNHDSIETVPEMEGMGITVLLNEHFLLSKGDSHLLIVGVDDPSYYRTDDIEFALANAPSADAVASIMLAHSPDLYEQAVTHQFGAYLCGHTHGGQICLTPGKALLKHGRCPSWTTSGSWAYEGLSGYTSRGAGTSIVHARFNCPPEITVHELVRQR